MDFIKFIGKFIACVLTIGIMLIPVAFIVLIFINWQWALGLLLWILIKPIELIYWLFGFDITILTLMVIAACFATPVVVVIAIFKG